MKKIKLATVCSGIGSPEVAVHELSEELNFEVVNKFACDIDKYAKASYLANFTPEEMFEDMTSDYFHENASYSDIFIGGIPCQAFSLSGKRLGELDKRGLLFYDFYRYVDQKRPKTFIIENVKGLISHNNGKTFQNWILLLGNSVNGHSQMFNHPDSLGYNLHWFVLNSKDFGVPQNRERVFVVGIRNDLPNNFRPPIGFPLTIRLKDVLETTVDEKYYLSDKMLEGFLKHQQNSEEKGRGFKFSPILDTYNQKASTITARCFKMGVDDNYISETTNLQGKEYINTIGSETQPAYCIRATESNSVIENKSRIRRLTPLECWRLQGFPDANFWKAKNDAVVNGKIGMSDTQLYKQAGNSMTTKVMKAIIKNLLPILLPA